MNTANKEFIEFRTNVDSWIKQIRAEFNDIQDVSNVVEENAGNIQHNYELVYELKDEIERLKQELNAMKVVQLATIRKQMVH